MPTKISICFIAKNEEKNIEKALKALNDSLEGKGPGADTEILLLDTGSTDNTVGIALKYGARVEYFDWINDFAAARNEAINLARNDFILFLDADEFIEKWDIRESISLLNKYPDAIGRMERRNLCNVSDGNTGIFTDRVERLFNRKHYRYEGCIHEQVVSYDGTLPKGYELPLTVYHEGYMGTKGRLKEKALRNNVLLYKELESHPDDPYIYYQLGQSYSLCGDSAKELEAYEKGYQLNPDRNAEYAGMMITSLLKLYINCDKLDGAVEMIQKEMQYYKHYADFLCMAGYAYMQVGRYEDSLSTYKKAFVAKLVHLEGSNGYRPAYNMGCIYEALGDELKAIEYYEMAKGFSASNKKLEEISERSEHFYEKKVSVLVPILKGASKQNIGTFLEQLEIQSIGMGHLEIIILVMPDVAIDIKDSIHIFENKYNNSVLLLEIQDEMRNSKLSATLYYEMLQYFSSDKVIFTSVDDKMSFDSIRLLVSYMDATGAEAVCDNIKYNDVGDFILDITNDSTRHAVAQAGILRQGVKGKIYKRGLIEKALEKNLFVEVVLKYSIEECFASKIYCLENNMIL